jgi:vancomycin resistance protein YoaR
VNQLTTFGLVAVAAMAMLASSATAAREVEVTPDTVAMFTTRFECCAARVTNIRCAPQLLDGRVIPAGGRFSMNAALGRRTRARGVVAAPMISGGRLVDSVGAGISQVATTLYNAAFFAGLRLVTHTPHSFYISRYPMGREATVSWGGPELVFENDWQAPLRMHLAVGARSVTARFDSKRLDRRVESWTGHPYAYRQPIVRVVHNPGLAAGVRRVVQGAGPPGFTIEYGRRVRRGERLLSNERWRVVYQPEDEVIEVGTR